MGALFNGKHTERKQHDRFIRVGHRDRDCPRTKAFQSVYQFPYILCYNVLYDFVSLIFSLIRGHNVLWEDITQWKL
ncbi:hypothetical protein D3Z53_04915 [Lachnospiraceae bacterium]|jgi:hypothetical protein|nr:hypothetical protein [Lachnospiraceae bacterium]